MFSLLQFSRRLLVLFILMDAIHKSAEDQSDNGDEQPDSTGTDQDHTKGDAKGLQRGDRLALDVVGNEWDFDQDFADEG